jgi:hypothetical protein
LVLPQLSPPIYPTFSILLWGSFGVCVTHPSPLSGSCEQAGGGGHSALPKTTVGHTGQIGGAVWGRTFKARVWVESGPLCTPLFPRSTLMRLFWFRRPGRDRPIFPLWRFVSLLYLFSAYQRTFGFLGLGVGKVPFGGHIFLGTWHIYRDGRGG